MPGSRASIASWSRRPAGWASASARSSRRIEVPIALPVIAAGLRSATVQVVATATLGALFGFGGLGRYLVDGVAQNDDGQIFGGVFLVAALALLAEGGFALLQRALTSPGLRLAQSSERASPPRNRLQGSYMTVPADFAGIVGRPSRHPPEWREHGGGIPTCG